MTMRKKLNYGFHNSNPMEATVSYVLIVFIEFDTGKISEVIQISLRETMYIRENHKDLFSTPYTKDHLLLLTF